MEKFIEIHIDGNAMLLNLNRVLEVWHRGDGTCKISAAAEDVFYTPDEPYERIRQMIASAQGGIPMDHSKMY